MEEVMETRTSTTPAAVSTGAGDGRFVEKVKFCENISFIAEVKEGPSSAEAVSGAVFCPGTKNLKAARSTGELGIPADRTAWQVMNLPTRWLGSLC